MICLSQWRSLDADLTDSRSLNIFKMRVKGIMHEYSNVNEDFISNNSFNCIITPKGNKPYEIKARSQLYSFQCPTTRVNRFLPLFMVYICLAFLSLKKYLFC